MQVQIGTYPCGVEHLSSSRLGLHYCPLSGIIDHVRASNQERFPIMSITKKEAQGLDEVYEVRAGIRHIGLYEDLEEAEQMAEFYDAEVFDWTTGDRV